MQSSNADYGREEENIVNSPEENENDVQMRSMNVSDDESENQNVEGSDSSNESDEEDGEEIEIEERRIVDMSPFFDQLRRVSRHNEGNCSFDELKVVKEIRIGFHSKLVFECGDCNKRFRVYATDDEKTTATVDINSS